MTEDIPRKRLDIRLMIERGRDQTVDWLPDATDDDQLHLALTAMANSDGGMVLLGLSQAGQAIEIKGVPDADATVDRLLKATLRLDPPLITPMPQIIEIDDKQIVAVEVPQGMPNVYAYDGRYVSRKHNENTPMRPIEIRQLFIERGEISFETEPARGATIDDLDWEKVTAYATSLRLPAGDARDLLHRRGCLTQRGDDFYPTNAGILLFGSDPQPFMRGAEITAVRFAGEAMGDTFSRQDITGTLPDQIRRAETFLIDHLRKGVKLKGSMAREEQFEYPMEAAREVVVNAVAHRDYSIEGDGIRLFLFKDRMEVNSPGTLPGPVTLENIKDERFSRNPAIVQVLSDMGFIERLGYGIDRVIALMKHAGHAAPEFSETRGGFRVVFTNAHTNIPGPHAPVSRAHISEKPAATPLNTRQEAALAHLKEPDVSRITNKKLQSMFPSVHAETIRRDLADLVNKGMLTKMGQKRGSYYVLRGTQTDGKSSENDESKG